MTGQSPNWKAEIAQRKALVIATAIALVLITLGILKTFLGSSSAHDLSTAPPVEATVSNPENFSTPDEVAKKLNAERKEKALTAVAQHEAIINSNPGADDVPDRLMAEGNLYSYQLSDYTSAIQKYRELVDKYPKHSQTPQAYVELATCYERMGEQAQAKYIYREMVENLDPSFQHTQYAKQKLEGK